MTKAWPVCAGCSLRDLAVLLLREHPAEVLGADPLTGEGMARWARGVLAIYGSGLLAHPEGGQL